MGFDQWQLHFTAPDEFFIYDQPADFRFTRDNGHIAGILINHRQTFKKISQ